MPHTNPISDTPVQKVVVINGNTEVLGMLESVLDSGRYDMVFVEPGDRAYSQIKKVLPNLVILCTRIERLDGFQILTMLKLDPDTCDIPVLTYTTEAEGQDFGTVLSQVTEDDDSHFPSRAASRMIKEKRPAIAGGKARRRASRHDQPTRGRGHGVSTDGDP